MNFRHVVMCPLLLAVSAGVLADPWKDESGNGKKWKKDDREHKEEYWDGPCKVERKFKNNGEYKEERKCKPQHKSHQHHEPVYEPYPSRGVTINGTVRIP